MITHKNRAEKATRSMCATLRLHSRTQRVYSFSCIDISLHASLLCNLTRASHGYRLVQSLAWLREHYSQLRRKNIENWREFFHHMQRTILIVRCKGVKIRLCQSKDSLSCPLPKPQSGRERRVLSSDAALDVKLTRLVNRGTGDLGTNPEQLFAAGYAACFLSAMKFVAVRDKLNFPSDASVEGNVGIGAIPTAFRGMRSS